MTQPLDTTVVRACEGSSDRAPQALDAVDGELCALDPEEPSDFFGQMFYIAETEGVGALFAGATTRALYIAALSSIQFFLYEFCKQALQVDRSALLLFFDVLSGLEIDN